MPASKTARAQSSTPPWANTPKATSAQIPMRTNLISSRRFSESASARRRPHKPCRGFCCLPGRSHRAAGKFASLDSLSRLAIPPQSVSGAAVLARLRLSPLSALQLLGAIRCARPGPSLNPWISSIQKARTPFPLPWAPSGKHRKTRRRSCHQTTRAASASRNTFPACQSLSAQSEKFLQSARHTFRRRLHRIRIRRPRPSNSSGLRDLKGPPTPPLAPKLCGPRWPARCHASPSLLEKHRAAESSGAAPRFASTPSTRFQSGGLAPGPPSPRYKRRSWLEVPGPKSHSHLVLRADIAKQLPLLYPDRPLRNAVSLQRPVPVRLAATGNFRIARKPPRKAGRFVWH